jgi:signal transduction histidine kinase
VSARVTGLKRRLLIRTAAATVIVLSLAAVAVYLMVRASLLAEFDDALITNARAVVALVEQEKDGIKIDEAIAQHQEFTRNKRPDTFVIWSENGTVAAQSQSLGNRQIPAFPPTATQTPTIFDVRMSEEKPGRAVVFRFSPHFEEPAAHSPSELKPATILVARHRHDLDERLEQLALVLTIVTIAATVAAVICLWFVVGQGLRPLSDLAAQIDAIDVKTQGTQLELAQAPQELRTVVTRLNQLLARVDEAVIHERRFSADVAHELRTPLAGLQATLDVCASRPRSVAEHERTVQRCSQIVAAMKVLVDNLLTLARADAGQIQVNLQEISLPDAIRDCWSQVATAAGEKSLACELQIDRAATVRSDPVLLAIVLRNLLDNAVAYAPQGGWISVETTAPETGAAILFRNNGCKLTREQLSEITQRFWRSDPARTGNGVHCGLGLALCQEISPMIGAELSFDLPIAGIFEAKLRLPAIADTSPESQSSTTRSAETFSEPLTASLS